ncbi:MAG: hypothetical protein KBI35_10435, partial [Ruminococcus sp.]|nr:hypothetical protein [Ruminococcus sp.]
MNKQDILNIICGNDKASIRMLYSLERQNGMNIDNHFSEEQNRKKGDYQELFWFRFIQLIFNNEIPYSIFYNSGESCKKSICKKTNCSHWSDNENWKTLDPENTKQSNVTYDPFSVVMDLCNYPSKYFDYREKTMEKVLTHHALSEWILAIYNNYKGHDGKVICTVHECEASNSPELYNFMTEHLKGYDDESNKKSAEYFRKIIDDFSYELVNSIRRIIGQAPITTEAISNDHINAILDDIKDPLVLIKSLIEVKFPGVISIENTEKKGVYCITWEGGKKYTGEVIDGKISGQGQIVFGDNGEWKEYSGEWNDGACHGKGKLLFKDGGYYDGNFVQNRADGFGTMIFSDDYPEFKEYSGNWKNDAWDGKG